MAQYVNESISKFIPDKDLFENILLEEEFCQVHPVVRNIFSKKIPRVNLAGRLQFFLEAWKVLTRDSAILEAVQGYKIPFQTTPKQSCLPHQPVLKAQETLRVQEEIESMLKKGAIQKVSHKAKEFISNLFLVSKKDGGNRPVINLKHLNSFIPYQHFKMEGLHLIQDMLQKGDYMCKIDSKDAYFMIPIYQEFRKFLRFQWQGNVYEFLCLCFGLGPAPLLFTKLMKIPLAFLRWLNVRLIIYLDDMLIFAHSKVELIQSRDTFDLPSATSGNDNQCKEIMSVPKSGGGSFYHPSWQSFIPWWTTPWALTRILFCI